MTKKRVWCLYRVSGKKQVSTEDDIPMQRNACREFVNSKPDWEITNELYEKGVSGWKKKAKDRDEMNEIRDAAINKKFDVLLVFLYDRLGRREDETPVVLQFLLKQGIEVWSVNEGQRKIESHIDKLLNYISFWQSDGESQKTSIRARESKKQLSEQGYFQGGIAPIGYKIVETDRPHWKVKDRFEKELVVDEVEAEIVKLVYSLYIEKHMGYRKIVDYLNINGYRTRDGKLFGVPTINRMLENPVYIGKKRYKGFDGNEGDTQPYNEKLRIISDDVFKMAQQIRKSRKEKLHDQEKSGIPLAGKLMFSGIAYCKYCGSKLSSNYLYRKQKYNGKEDYYTNTVYRYRCPLNKGKHNCNHEQNIWGSKKYDNIIIKQVKS
ncbi:recombinase family protein, partial [Butyricicoccus sp. 1XD8-22]